VCSATSSNTCNSFNEPVAKTSTPKHQIAVMCVAIEAPLLLAVIYSLVKKLVVISTTILLLIFLLSLLLLSVLVLVQPVFVSVIALVHGIILVFKFSL